MLVSGAVGKIDAWGVLVQYFVQGHMPEMYTRVYPSYQCFVFFSILGKVEHGTASDDTERTTSMKLSDGSFVSCLRGPIWLVF